MAFALANAESPKHASRLSLISRLANEFALFASNRDLRLILRVLQSMTVYAHPVFGEIRVFMHFKLALLNAKRSCRGSIDDGTLRSPRMDEIRRNVSLAKA